MFSIIVPLLSFFQIKKVCPLSFKYFVDFGVILESNIISYIINAIIYDDLIFLHSDTKNIKFERFLFALTFIGNDKIKLLIHFQLNARPLSYDSAHL